MLFLIDLENVRDSGFVGSDVLQSDDELIIFYSDAALNLSKTIVTNIKNSNCMLDTYKLKTTGKNALDFYIATKLGEKFGNGYNKTAIIVSNDSGFKAVREFWTFCSENKHSVFVSKSIEAGIISAQEHNERTKIVQRRTERITIETLLAEYNDKPKSYYETLFGNTEFSSQTESIEQVFENCKNNKEAYLKSLHYFGKTDGLAIYNIVKNNAVVTS